MKILEIFFWLSVAFVFYTYIGYGIIAWILASGTKLFKRKLPLSHFEPEVSIIVPAYNEADILEPKIKNCFSLNYPSEKLHIIFITDGSTDHSAKILSAYPKIKHLHSPERAGKAMAENRVMEFVKTPYVIFTDCNTFLNKEAVREMVKHYQDPLVGAVSGEKKVMALENSTSGSGEGLYWKYESFLKRCDSQIYSLMGAAGELVSFRSDLFLPLEKDTILDDFVQSLRIVKKGFKVIYEPNAYAQEAPSASLADEMKRKIRICAGGWQAMVRLKSLLNPFRHPLISFLYISHRVLRWSITPVFLALLLPLSLILLYTDGHPIFILAFILQSFFYIGAWLAWQKDGKGKSYKILLVPLYFSMMNIAVFAGFTRYVRRTQSAAWDKAERSIMPS